MELKSVLNKTQKVESTLNTIHDAKEQNFKYICLDYIGKIWT